MFKLAELFVEVTAHTSGVNTALAGLHTRLLGMGPVGAKISGGIHAATNAYLGLGSVGPVALGACAAGAAALAIGMGKVAFQAAHLQEAIAKVEQAFGSSAGPVKATADDLARRFGAVRREVLDTAASFGLMLQGAGVDRQLSAQMSAMLTRVAVDAASYFDVEMSEAITRLQSGLSGEMEAVRRWGINLTESNIKTKAQAMGFENPENLDQGTKTLIRYKLIMEGLTAAQGDAERSSGRLVGQWKIFTGQLSELGIALGERVVPILTVSLHVLNGFLSIWVKIEQGINAAAKALFGFVGGLLGWDVAGDQAKAKETAAIDARIDAANAALKGDEKKAKELAEAGKKKPKEREERGFEGGFPEWARHIQQGAWGRPRDQVQKEQLQTQKAMEALLKDIKQKLAQPKPVVI